MRGVLRLVSAEAVVFAGSDRGVMPTVRPATDVICCGAVDVDIADDWLRFAVASVANALRILESCSLAAVVTAGFLLSGPEKILQTAEWNKTSN